MVKLDFQTVLLLHETGIERCDRTGCRDLLVADLLISSSVLTKC